MSAGVILYGETTRELYGAWHARVGAAPTISQAEIQPLFNDIALRSPSLAAAAGGLRAFAATSAPTLR